METETHVFFYGHTPNKSGTAVFSQWYPISFRCSDGNTYANAEQYMMAHKALLFGDNYYYKKIMETNDPGLIKKYGREIRGFDPVLWDEHKFDIVVEGNRLKFGQNSKLLERLLQTSNKTIVEAAPNDRVWGIGLTAQQAVKVPENKWPGQNLLGKALVVVRNELK